MNKKRLALIGNPNSGKSSLFNLLTGLDQKVANFAGVTVEKKEGEFTLSNQTICTVVDLPGTYSLYPKKEDEEVSCEYILSNLSSLDLLIVTIDAANLKRNLLFCSQIIDLKIPVLIALTMTDIAKKRNIQINTIELQRLMGVSIVEVNPRKNKHHSVFKKAIEKKLEINTHKNTPSFLNPMPEFANTIQLISNLEKNTGHYVAFQYAIYPHLNKPFEKTIQEINIKTHFNKTRAQAQDIQQRYQKIDHVLKQSVVIEDALKKEMQTHRLDNILLHQYWGYLIMFFVLFLMFQSVFWLAQFPMNGIEYVFEQSTVFLNQYLPSSIFTDLLTKGILSGLGGILVFIPQIAILTGLISLLEDSGYMARISFLTDKTMRSFGLNGKSLIPLIGGLACAVPAIMNTRNIENKKEKILTIFILPLITCSARLPVFTMLIALIVPNTYFGGFLSFQGLALMLLYLSGFLLSFLIAFVLKFMIRSKEKSFFILELPFYKSPRWQNLFQEMYSKTKIFVLNAGKIIMIISVILWLLSNFGSNTQEIETQYNSEIQIHPEKKDSLLQAEAAAYLENSYAGKLGKTIEPLIEPIGFDWKIGIALITSFAAREVFVGTMATLYSFDESMVDDNPKKLQEKLMLAKKENGSPVFTLASTCSLILFYLISLQCMSTFAVIKRETKSWKFAFTVLVFYTTLAYILSFIVYNILK